MTGQERPKLSLGEPPAPLARKPSSNSFRWFVMIILTQVFVLYVLTIIVGRLPKKNGLGPAHAALPSQDIKAQALALEERSLAAQAARAWQDYLNADQENAERAEVLYRIGTLHMQADQFDEAAAALVRAELAAADDADLRAKIGRKLVECLRRLGRYGEVGRELSRQVEAGAESTGKGEVLATLDGEPLTEADLDRMIERHVDRLLAAQGVSRDETTREAILREFSTPEARSQMLQQLIRSELFCRRARELKLDRDEEFLQARQLMEQDLLASRFLAEELEKIRPTEVDLQSYYQANEDRYREPESAEVRVISLGPDDDPAKLLAGLKSADDFRKLAAERRSPDSSGEGPPARTIVRGRRDLLLGDVEPLFELAEGEWTAEPLVHGDRKHLVLVEKKTAARTPPLSEIAARVEADYAQAKQRELTQALAHDLMQRYDVQIVPPSDEPANVSPPTAKPDAAPPKPDGDQAP